MSTLEHCGTNMTPSEKYYKPRPKLIPPQDIDAELDRILAESSEDYVPPKKSWIKKIKEFFEPTPQTYFIQNSDSIIKAHMDFHKSLNETHNNVEELIGVYTNTLKYQAESFTQPPSWFSNWGNDFPSHVSTGIFKLATMATRSTRSNQETKVKNFYKNKRKR